MYFYPKILQVVLQVVSLNFIFAVCLFVCFLRPPLIKNRNVCTSHKELKKYGHVNPCFGSVLPEWTMGLERGLQQVPWCQSREP